jgi:membrane protein
MCPPRGPAARMDRLQRRWSGLGFPVAVVRKYADDQGPRLAALLTSYGFLSLFPLLLVAVAVLTETLAAHPDLRDRLLDELVAPSLRPDIEQALEALPPSGLPLVAGLLGLLLSGTGGVVAAHAALNQIWAVPFRERFGWVVRYVRVVLVLLVVLAGAIVVAVLGVAAGSVLRLEATERLASALGSFAVAFAVLVVAYKALTARRLSFREIWLGAVLGGAVITAVVALGTTALAVLITRSGAVYGSFATVAGAFTLLYLVSQGLVVSAEATAVYSLRLWPRSLHTDAPPTEADMRALELLARIEERVRYQHVLVRFETDREHAVAAPDRTSPDGPEPGRGGNRQP